MSERTMYIDHDAMAKVVDGYEKVSTEITNSFEKIDNIVQQVTNNDSWRGQDSDAFLEQFESIRQELKMHVEELEGLSPAMKNVDGGYSQREEENTADIKNRGVRDV